MALADVLVAHTHLRRLYSPRALYQLLMDIYGEDWSSAKKLPEPSLVCDMDVLRSYAIETLTDRNDSMSAVNRVCEDVSEIHVCIRAYASLWDHVLRDEL